MFYYWGYKIVTESDNGCTDAADGGRKGAGLGRGGRGGEGAQAQMTATSLPQKIVISHEPNVFFTD
jgi:hypothetical protein